MQTGCARHGMADEQAAQPSNLRTLLALRTMTARVAAALCDTVHAIARTTGT